MVPLSTKREMVAKIRAAGAREVVQIGASWAEADGYLREVAMGEAESRGEEAVYVPPFDHEDVWRGNGTVVHEVNQQLRGLGETAPGVVVCSVGGGGLFNGIVDAVEELAGSGWARTTVLALETEGAHSLAHSLARNELSTLPAITSQATSLGATRVSSRTFELAQQHIPTGRVKTAVLSDAEAAMGCWRFAEDERVLVELACGVAVAVCYGGRLERVLGRKVSKEEKVVIVVCGGSNVSTQMIEGWRREFGDLDVDNGEVNGDGMANGHGKESGHVVVPSAVAAENGA